MPPARMPLCSVSCIDVGVDNATGPLPSEAGSWWVVNMLSGNVEESRRSDRMTEFAPTLQSIVPPPSHRPIMHIYDVEAVSAKRLRARATFHRRCTAMPLVSHAASGGEKPMSLQWKASGTLLPLAWTAAKWFPSGAHVKHVWSHGSCDSASNMTPDPCLPSAGMRMLLTGRGRADDSENRVKQELGELFSEESRLKSRASYGYPGPIRRDVRYGSVSITRERGSF